MARHRTQLLLEPEQYRAISQLAREQERSISDLVREFVDLGLAHAREFQEQKLRALSELHELRTELESRAGVLPGDPLRETRSERERQTDAVLFGPAEP